MSIVESNQKINEPWCTFEACGALYEPCCFLMESQKAIVDEEIMADITNSAKDGTSNNKEELLMHTNIVPNDTTRAKLHTSDGSTECNSPKTLILANNIGSKESPVGAANAIQIHNQDPGSNTKENTELIIYNPNESSAKSKNYNSIAGSYIKDTAIQIYNSKTVGRRRARAKKLRSVFVNPKELRACNNVVVECVGVPGLTPESMPLRIRRTDLWKDYQELGASEKTVVVAIEATHISPLDLCIRHGLFADEVKAPFVLGSNFVGIVHHGALPKGIRVAALTKTGSNARYIATTADALVKVPKRFDASEVACLISSYLPALQALHNGRHRDCKYAKDSLTGKKVLLTDGGSMVELQAMVQLAFAAGAASVNVVCDDRYHNYVRMHLKAKPLRLDIMEWLPQVLGEMDVVIDYDYSLHRHEINEALAPRGRLVWFVNPPKEQHNRLLSNFQDLLDQAAICATEGGSIYNVYDNWAFARDESKEDLKYLFTLLATRKIRPKIDCFIALDGIRQAHDDMQTRGIIGSIICEPWKEA